VYRSAAELIADMPPKDYPKSGPMGNAERQDAEKWLKANVVGRTIEWTATVTEVTDKGADPYEVALVNDRAVTLVTSTGAPVDHSYTFGPAVSLAGESCQFLTNWNHTPYKSCTRPELNTLRGLKGKKVAFRSTVIGASVRDRDFIESTKHLLIQLDVTLPSVDGFLPAASKKKDTK